MTSNAFIAIIGEKIKEEAKERGYNYPSAIIAQACLESGFGNSLLASKYHNYFGMKCGSSWKGSSVNMKTKEEYTKGTLTNISANFRVYDDMEAGVRGYFDFISTPRYKKLKSATSTEEYCKLIKECGYATSSVYVQSLKSMITSYDLKKFDRTIEKTPATPSKALTSVAFRVIRGEFGDGETRRKKLAAAGYDYDKVQAEVNRILKGGK